MESLAAEDVQRAEKRRSRRKRVIVGTACALVLVLTVTVVVAVVVVTRRHGADRFRGTFISRCELFQGRDCQKLWSAFQQAYVGKDPCDVPQEAYDPVIAEASFRPTCDRMMFWSKTKEVVHHFTAKHTCFVTMEDSILGHPLDNLTWCGREGSTETFTSGCPGWSECVNNPVRSYWNRASFDFAAKACGDVTVMLNGSIEAPFSPNSIFGSIEVKQFHSPRVRSLTVVLVTRDHAVSTCTNASFKDLQMALDKGITYRCTEVTESQLHQCSSDTGKPCGPCW